MISILTKQKKRLIMFDCTQELERLKNQTKAIRKKSYSKSKSRLDKYTSELIQLRKAGATFTELQRFLRSKRIKVALSTVTRYIRKIDNNG